MKVTRATRKALSRFAIHTGALWLVQILPLAWVLSGPTWDQYWQLRQVYRPGLTVYRWALDGWLPARFFSPFDRTGVILGFTFAAMLYALLAVGLWVLVRKIMKK